MDGARLWQGGPAVAGWRVAMAESAGAWWLEPGQFVRHPSEPGWGLGQVQSVIGDRVTVSFAHRGKVLINAAYVMLEAVEVE